MTTIISDPHESHIHVFGTLSHKSSASHGHGEDEHSHQKVERTGIYFVHVMIVTVCALKL